MFSQEDIEALERIQADCKAKNVCDGCIAFSQSRNRPYGTCILDHRPQGWELTELKKRAGQHTSSNNN